MERFLSQCAKYIFEKHGNKLHQVCLVFPNRRAGVFFNAYLQHHITKPVVGANITTIGELFSGFSTYYEAEKLELISILFDVFKKHTQTTETFDEFYFWGEILLSDFGEIDRYLVNAKDLFSNLSDLKQIESVFDYLTDKQKEALKQFWAAFSQGQHNEFQKKYATIWGKLFPVYHEFKQLLIERNLAYPGMAEREVVEKLQRKEIIFNHNIFYFIGLNVLTACEKQLFRFLQMQQKAEFLWDFDEFYTNDDKNQAGKFVRKNRIEFPAPGDFLLNTNQFKLQKNINLVAVSSVFGQAQQVPLFFNEIETDITPRFDNTAVVLADESLLFSTLSALPESIEKVNVTMGYEVKNSVIYGFLLLLVKLLKNARLTEKQGFVSYFRFVTDLLTHQLLAQTEPVKTSAFLNDIKTKNKITLALNEINFSDLHQRIFLLPEKVSGYSDYFLGILGLLYEKIQLADAANKILSELIYTIYQSVEKLKIVTEKVSVGNKTLSSAIYFRLFGQYLSQVTVAFEGEPLAGMQVMGILETRCLDFKNVLILGLNENKWPRAFTAPSFVPYNLRKGFGLPGIDEQDAMYSYYFYRLIQRAKNVTATYNVIKEGMSTGEMSRFGHQLLYDSPHQPALKNITFSFGNDPASPVSVKSSAKTVKILLEKNSEKHALSPTAINSFLNCSLRFYYRYVAGLPEPDDVKEEIDAQVFGTVFHDVMEELYKPFIGRSITTSIIDNLAKNKLHIENEILKKIALHYLKEKEKTKVELEGKQLLIFENLITYIKQVLNIDREITPFILIGLEHKFQHQVEIKVDGRKRTIFIGGTIDRIDQVGDTIRIIDYKTGKVESSTFEKIEELFERDQKKHKKEILQALIYSWIYNHKIKKQHVKPVIYALKNLFEIKPALEIKWSKHEFSWPEIEAGFLLNLKNLVQEIYSEDTVFEQTLHTDKCKFCPYQLLCRRF